LDFRETLTVEWTLSMGDSEIGYQSGLESVDWRAVLVGLRGPGWARLPAALAPGICGRLIEAAPGGWASLPETEGGGVRQGGLSCHAEISPGSPTVGVFAESICAAINTVRSAEALAVPLFNHAQWTRSNGGIGFITAHRDPPIAAGIIAIATLRGRAVFRVWDDNPNSPGAHPLAPRQWDTGDGDLVLLRGGGWPVEDARCPRHEAESPVCGERITLTLRHNKRGYGSAYFS
jgi:hypothetical protein